MMWAHLILYTAIHQTHVLYTPNTCFIWHEIQPVWKVTMGYEVAKTSMLYYYDKVSLC